MLRPLLTSMTTKGQIEKFKKISRDNPASPKGTRASWCKKAQEIVPDQLLVLEIRALKFLNGTKLILDDHGNNLDSFRISLDFF